MYKLLPPPLMQTESVCVVHLQKNLHIPFDPSNTDYQEYLKWLDGYELLDGQWVRTSVGNTPEPADE